MVGHIAINIENTTNDKNGSYLKNEVALQTVQDKSDALTYFFLYIAPTLTLMKINSSRTL